MFEFQLGGTVMEAPREIKSKEGSRTVALVSKIGFVGGAVEVNLPLDRTLNPKMGDGAEVMVRGVVMPNYKGTLQFVARQVEAGGKR